MPTDLLAPLVGLALVDSTSFGTLLIPLWLMLAPGRLRVHRVLIFLGTVATYYLVLGIALLAGATQLAGVLSGFLDTPAAAWLQLALGVGLFVLSFRLDPKTQEKKRAKDAAHTNATSHSEAADVGASTSVRRTEPGAVAGGAAEANAAVDSPTGIAIDAPASGRVAQWRSRAMSAEGRGTTAALIGLALAAAGIETASMLPYLSAIGLLTASDLTLASGALVLVGYCFLMILPALLLLAVRVVAYRYVRATLQRFEAWMSRSAASATAWIVGIIGVLLVLDALSRTGVTAVLGGVG